MRGRLIVMADKTGQLGNQLVRFAHLVAFAESYGVSVCNLGFDDYASLFPAFAHDPLCRYPLVRARLARLASSALMTGAARVALRAAARSQVKAVDNEVTLSNPAFVSRARSRRLLVGQGFLFRDDEALVRHAARVREVFTPKAVVLDTARQAAEGELVVGIHRRRGDYRTWNEGRYFYDDDVLARAMTRIEALHPDSDVTFLVCSDEPLDPSAFPSHRVRVGPGNPVADLYALAHCDRLTGPPSTFSAWASFWGEVPLATLEEPDQQFRHDSFAVAWSG